MTKFILLLLLMLTSCIEYRLTRPGLPDKYIGWSRTKPGLDPRVGPKAKIFFTDQGRIRPYLGGEIIRQEELLLGLGVVYYVNDNKSFELGIRDSVYRDSGLLDRYRDDDTRFDPWQDENPIFYFGGVLIF